ncbi:MAG: hypothetical protein HY558_08520 [Euryarchaeota archaeon]|nr:hypothetical protein [Euryarchaeota archaeon]
MSSLIGALMALVIFVGFLAALQTTAVPDQNRQTEAARDQTLGDQMRALQAGVAATGADGSPRSASAALGVRYPQLLFLSSPLPGASGSINTSLQRINLTYYGQTDGAPVDRTVAFALVNFPFYEVNLSTLSNFSIYISDLEKDEDIDIRSNGSYYTGNPIRLTRINDPGVSDPRLQVSSTVCNTIYATYFTTPFTIDLLPCEPGLGSGNGGTHVSFTTSAGGGDAASGTYRVAGTHVNASAPGNSTPLNGTSAAVQVFEDNNYLPPASLRYEHGALLRLQGASTVSLANATLLAATHNTTTNTTAITISAVLLDSANRSEGGGETRSLTLTRPDSPQTTTALARNFTLTLETPYPGLWASLFNTTLAASGLVQAGNWTTTQEPQRLILTVDRGTTPRIDLTVATSRVSLDF